MDIRQVFNVVVLDVNGNVLYEFKNVVPNKVATTVTLSSDKFVKNQVVELVCVAENAISGEVMPEEVIGEVTQEVEGQ